MVPVTISRPFSVAAPVRKALPIDDIGDVLDADGNAAARGDDRLRQILGGASLAGHTDQDLLAAPLEIARPNIGVVAFERLDDIHQRKAERCEALRVRCDMILLGVAADGVDFGYAWHGAKLRPDHPVMQGAKVGRGP